MLFKIILILLSFSTLTTSIYNGKIANPHQFPYVVLIESPRFYCSGTLISPLHVLTAAHCLMSVKKGNAINVTVGSHYFTGRSNSDGFLMNSYKFWIHENFSMPSAVNDIGLVELPVKVEVSKSVKFIGVEERDKVDYDEWERFVLISGWGYSSPSTPSKVLRFDVMRILPLDQCQDYKSHYIETMNENNICSIKIENMPCDGDSGAGLVSLKSGKLIGILSYVKDAENGRDLGYNDCKSNIPAVSTRISSFVRWIEEKSGLKF